MAANRLYFGDCLDIMREDLPDGCADLIYLDPPFNSKRIYNAFMGGAQWVAFDDTWRWHEAIDDFHETAGDVALAGTMEGLRSILGEGANLAYLSYMANRLRECRRVLSETGSIYLHCDPTMSHYLKVVMDGVFGQPMQNEFIWYYSGGGASKRRWARKHDVLLFYAKGKRWTFNADAVREPHKWTAGQRRADGSERDYGRGKLPDDVWERHSIMPWSKERLGYPTQKPLALLDRLVKASSNPGDTVLDPFCGCGTTLHAAQALGRRWIGIDISVNACKVIEKRLTGHFDSVWDEVEFVGMPKTVADAHTLAALDKFRFERWAAALVDGIEPNARQRGDRGIDGRGRIPIRKGTFVDVVSQVKGGGTGPGDVRAFDTARRQAGAEIGVFVCFEDRVTQGMRDTAAGAGRFMGVPAIQIYTVEDYFAGRAPRMPGPAGGRERA